MAPISWRKGGFCSPKPLAVTTYVHLDPKASDYAEAKAAWDALTAGGELKTSGSTWNEAMGGPDFAKRELVLFKRPTGSIVAENDADEGKGTDGFFTVSRAADDPMTMPLTVRFEDLWMQMPETLRAYDYQVSVVRDPHVKDAADSQTLGVVRETLEGVAPDARICLDLVRNGGFTLTFTPENPL